MLLKDFIADLETALNYSVRAVEQRDHYREALEIIAESMDHYGGNPLQICDGEGLTIARFIKSILAS